jgi:phage shock protein C
MSVSPIFSATGAVIFLWIFARVINIVSIYTGVDILARLAFFIDIILVPLFWLVIFIGYIVFILRMSHCCEGKERRGTFMANKRGSGKVKRLYRSGKDKMLGGVCGGIAEYLGVDPVLIRLLWILAIFAWGSGILAYIIAWIIIPRNPNHKWK